MLMRLNSSKHANAPDDARPYGQEERELEDTYIYVKLSVQSNSPPCMPVSA